MVLIHLLIRRLSFHPELIAYPKNYPSVCDTWLWSQFLLRWKTKTYTPKIQPPTTKTKTNKQKSLVLFKGKGDKKRLNLCNFEICSFFKFTQQGQIRAPKELAWAEEPTSVCLGPHGLHRCHGVNNDTLGELWPRCGFAIHCNYVSQQWNLRNNFLWKWKMGSEIKN